MHGSGVVRAGQWSRSLIMNHSLDHGTILPYITKAKSLGYEIIITNGNDNLRTINGKTDFIPGSKSQEEHAATIFTKIVLPLNPKCVAIVAHSYGGIVTMHLADTFKDYFKSKVFAIAFTDSVHCPLCDDDLMEFLKTIGRNYVTSDKTLNEELVDKNDTIDIPKYSAGHTKHEWTSYTSIEPLFEFLEEKYRSSNIVKEII